MQGMATLSRSSMTVQFGDSFSAEISDNPWGIPFVNGKSQIERLIMKKIIFQLFNSSNKYVIWFLQAVK
jgi:hypothetical protein